MRTIASVIDIIIQAQDRASRQFRETSAEAKKMAAIIGAITIATAGMTPALLGGLGAIAALFGTAGLAAGGFAAISGTAIMSAFENAGNLEDAMLDVNAAMINNDAKGYAKAMAKVQAIWESMTESEQRAVVAINDFKDEWKDMQIQMSSTTFDLITESMDFMSRTMTGIFPAMKKVGESFVGMFGYMNQAIESGRVDPFFEHINTYAVPMFERVMLSAGNILKAFGGIMVAFTPLGMQLGDGMVDLTDKFAKWAWGLQSNPAFQEFVAMVQQSTPVIMNLIGQIVLTLWDMIKALYPVSIQVLQLAADFLEWSRESGALEFVLKLVSGIVLVLIDNMDILAPIIVGVTTATIAANAAFKVMMIVQSVAKGIELLAAMLGLSRIATVGQTGAQMALNGAMLANPIGLVIGLIAALITIGVLLWANWDDITKACKDMWSTMKEKWELGVQIIKAAYSKMVFEAKKWWSETRQSWDDMVKVVKVKAEEMKQKAIKEYENMKQAAVQKMLGLYYDAQNKWNEMKTDASNKVNQMKTDVANKYESMKTDAKNKLSEIANDASRKWNEAYNNTVTWVSNLWEAGKANAKAMYQGFKNNIGDIGSAVWDGLKGAWQVMKDWGNTFYNSGAALLGEFADGVWKGVKMAYDNVWEGMNYIRRLLPFSPSKDGPLRDLDKSGEAFFPTWYEAALTQVGSMQRAVGSAFSGVAKEANVALAGTGLEQFSGGKTTLTVNHVVTVEGDVSLDSRGLEDLQSTIQQQVVSTTGVGAQGFGFDKQVIRRN